jgi:hypothetical protein
MKLLLLLMLLMLLLLIETCWTADLTAEDCCGCIPDMSLVTVTVTA